MTTYADTVSESVATTTPLTSSNAIVTAINELLAIVFNGGTSNNDTLSETISLADSDAILLDITSSISELLTAVFRGGPSTEESVEEIAAFITTLVNHPVFSTSVSSSILINSSAILNLFNAITESIVLSTTSTNKKDIIVELLDNISKSSALTSSASFGNNLSDTLNILDILELAILETISEELVLNDTLSFIQDLRHVISDTLTLTSIASATFLYLYTISESLESTDTSTTNITLNQLLEESLLIRIGSSFPNETYLTYLLSPETNSISNYENYNFNLSTKFNNKYLFANTTGLYEFGGTTDDGVTIRSELETVAFNFNSSNLKQVPYLYLGVDSNSSFILKVRVDGKGEFHYKLNKYTNNLMTQKIDIGKGLIGRYFQFEIITDASEFNMESIEFIPLEIRRKL